MLQAIVLARCRSAIIDLTGADGIDHGTARPSGAADELARERCSSRASRGALNIPRAFV